MLVEVVYQVWESNCFTFVSLSTTHVELYAMNVFFGFAMADFVIFRHSVFVELGHLDFIVNSFCLAGKECFAVLVLLFFKLVLVFLTWFERLNVCNVMFAGYENGQIKSLHVVHIVYSSIDCCICPHSTTTTTTK